MHFDFSIILNNWSAFAYGTGITILVAAISIVAAFLLAIPIALMALSNSKVLRAVAAVYLECFRNLPFIVIVYIFYYGLPTLQIRLPETVIGILALSFFTSSYFSELIRGAILSVPKGQMEAARAVGMSYFQGMRDIVAPQTLRSLLPPCTSTSISTVKETSVLSVITVGELTFQGLIVQGNSFAPFEVFITTAAIYWIITALLAALLNRIERSPRAVQGHGDTRLSLADQFLKLDA